MNEISQEGRLLQLKDLAAKTDELDEFAFGPNGFSQAFADYFPLIRELFDAWQIYRPRDSFVDEATEVADLDNMEAADIAALQFLKSLINWKMTDDEIEALAIRIPSRVQKNIRNAISHIVVFSREIIVSDLGGRHEV